MPPKILLLTDDELEREQRKMLAALPPLNVNSSPASCCPSTEVS